MSNWIYDQFGVLTLEAKPPLPVPEGFLQTSEMASILGVKHFTVAKWCREGKLPATWYKPPSGTYGKWIIEAKVFEEILQSLTDTSNQ